jgi:hypothetical protein
MHSNLKRINMYYDETNRALGKGFFPRVLRQTDRDSKVEVSFSYNCVLNAWIQLGCDDNEIDDGIASGFDEEELRLVLGNEGTSVISQYGGDVILKFSR